MESYRASVTHTGIQELELLKEQEADGHLIAPATGTDDAHVQVRSSPLIRHPWTLTHGQMLVN